MKSPFLTYTVQRTESGGVHFTPSTSEKPFSYSGKFGKNRRTYFEAGFNYTISLERLMQCRLVAL